MQIIKLEPRQGFASNSYILVSENEAVVVDPSFPMNEVLTRLEDGVKIVAAVLTHAHFDHMLEIDSYLGVPVLVGIEDAAALSDSRLNCYYLFLGEDRAYRGEYKTLAEGDEICFGSERITVMQTPGHTRGGISLYAEGVLFVGDTVFAGGGYGRVDLPGGSYGELFSSIKKISALPTGTRVYPGHGEATDINEIRKYFG